MLQTKSRSMCKKRKQSSRQNFPITPQQHSPQCDGSVYCSPEAETIYTPCTPAQLTHTHIPSLPYSTPSIYPKRLQLAQYGQYCTYLTVDYKVRWNIKWVDHWHLFCCYSQIMTTEWQDTNHHKILTPQCKHISKQLVSMISKQANLKHYLLFVHTSTSIQMMV